jgi:hypothetical protein
MDKPFIPQEPARPAVRPATATGATAPPPIPPKPAAPAVPAQPVGKTKDGKWAPVQAAIPFGYIKPRDHVQPDLLKEQAAALRPRALLIATGGHSVPRDIVNSTAVAKTDDADRYGYVCVYVYMYAMIQLCVYITMGSSVYL